MWFPLFSLQTSTSAYASASVQPSSRSSPHGSLDPLSQRAFLAFLSHCLRVCVPSSHVQNQEYCPCLGQVSTRGRAGSTSTHRAAQQSSQHLYRKECIPSGHTEHGDSWALLLEGKVNPRARLKWGSVDHGSHPRLLVACDVHQKCTFPGLTHISPLRVRPRHMYFFKASQGI